MRWFSEEVQPHGEALRSYLRWRYPAVRDIEDLVQESYLKVWRARLKGRITASKSFLFQVARHLAIDLLRREGRVPFVAVSDAAAEAVVDEGIDVAEAASVSEELILLAEAIDALPSRCRQVMVLRQVEGASYREIALLLGISELTVQTHVATGLRRVERYLLRHADGRSAP